MTKTEAIEWLEKDIKLHEVFNETKHQDKAIEALNMAIDALEQEPSCRNPRQVDLISRQDAVNEIHKYFAEEIDKTPTEIDKDGDELYADMPTVNSLLACNKELSKRIKALPSAEPNLLCALADRECPFQGKEFAWCLTCPHISVEDRALVKKVASEPKRGKWIDKGNFYICSECGKRMPYAVLGSKLSRAYAFMSDYCPNCGARMESDEE